MMSHCKIHLSDRHQAAGTAYGWCLGWLWTLPVSSLVKNYHPMGDPLRHAYQLEVGIWTPFSFPTEKIVIW